MYLIITGIVIGGNKLGRQLGFSTANIPLPVGVEVEGGVYAAVAETGGVRYKAVANVGYSPSVTDGSERRLEVHLIDFLGDLYGSRVTVELVEKLRDERKFASREELSAQICADKEQAKRIINL